jgi:hypothetical protein
MSLQDFDFLVGRWKVQHRRLRTRLAGSNNWEEFDGECSMQKILGGQANIDDNVLNAPRGTYRAMSVRVFEPAQDTWSIFWIDSRYPPAAIANPVVGRFVDGRGVFHSDDQSEGRKVRTRYLWLVDHAGQCRWEQALSADAGATWETNWYMRFSRVQP